MINDRLLSGIAARDHWTVNPWRNRGTGRHTAARSAALAILCGAAFCSQTIAQSNVTLSGHASLEQVHVNPQTVQVTVIDGHDIRFSRLSTDAGLSQTRVAQIVQDDLGFMWFGTQYGLNRYDGYKFKVFTPDQSRQNSISGTYIYALFKDRSGILWIGSGQYLDRFDPTTEAFTHYRIVPRNDPPVTVVQISQDPAGLLWLATSNGLYGLDSATGQITHRYSHDPLNPLSLSSNDVRSVGEDRSGRFWVADGSTIEQLDRKTGNVSLRVTLASSPRYFSFYEDSAGMLWVPNSGGPFARLDPDSRELTYYSFYDEKARKASTANVVAMLQDKDGVLWLGTLGAGLLRFDPLHRTAIRYRNHAGNLESLAEDRIIALTQDNEGNVWVGMHAREPNFFPPRKLSFRPLLSNDINLNSLGERLINFIYEDRRGILWVSTTGALLGIDRKTGKYRSYLPPGDGFNNDIVAIAEDRSGTLWVGTIGRGLNRFEPDTGRFIAYLHDPAVPSSLSNDAVDHLYVDHKGTIWVGTRDGLNRFDPASGRFLVYKRDGQSGAQAVYGIAEDQDGALWLGGTSGLQRFDPRTAKFTAYQHKLDDPNSISDDRVINIYTDQSGAVWATTHNGLNKLDPQSGTFTRYYVRDGLPSNRLNCIEPDRSGHLWISTTAGLSQFDPRTKVFKNYSVTDGLPGMDLSGWSACAKSRTGEMYFGGFSGGTSFYPEEIADSTYIPPVVFTDFQLAGLSAGVGGGSPLKRSISYSQGVTLSHTQAMFALEFTALSYSSQATNRYRYKLEPLDSKWHEVGSWQRLVNYTELPAGEYKFRVQGAASHGPWSDPGASLRIEILPAWWNTSWFRSICVLLVLLSVYALYSYRIRQVARQFELRLDERVSERTRIARELHDTLLQSFQGLMLRFQSVDVLLPGRPDAAKGELDRALQRADQAIAEARDSVQGLRSSAETTNDLADALRALGDELAEPVSGSERTQFRVLVEGASRDLHPILRDEIYRLAREAVRNAFRHAQATRIEIEIGYGDRLLRVRIRDDGRGIDSAFMDTGREGHYGLVGMRERAAGIGGQLTMWSATGAGTEIELSIPGSIAYGASPARRSFRLLRKG